jgi:hypothetical protein
MHFWKVFAYFWGWTPKSTPTIDWFTTFGHFKRSFGGICQIFAKTWGSTTVAMGPFIYYVSTGGRGLENSNSCLLSMLKNMLT